MTPIEKTHDKQTFTDTQEQEIFDFWLTTGHTESFLGKKYGCGKSVINVVLNKGLAKRQGEYNKSNGGRNGT